MARVFVKGFKRQYSEEVLNLMFRPFGEVKSIKINNLTAVVDYDTMESATRAISTLQNRALADTSVLTLDLFYNSKKRIAVRNEFPVADVQAALSRHGRIYSIRETPAHILVDFYDENDVRKILASRIWMFQDPSDENKGRYLKITQIRNKPVNDDQTVFVYNIPQNFNENDMLELFTKYGDIVSSGVQNDRGFVNFSRPLHALRAFKNLDGKRVRNRRLRLKIKGSGHSALGI